ncbi:hypothetical protein BDN72DRAFT_843038 [Pluteus cervinus]|uniref:Uncharacterized protein n=1 Tax=Pluteus cervinus TaxID=181527 RepID=A0ACD3AQ48_9AGAR|nr:hypothetical protein BDN72DRAFT_843038 [Pluteus cervinus]
MTDFQKTTSPITTEVPYTDKELKALPNKNSLYECITRQRDRWPKDIPLNLSKTKRSEMESALLNPKNGFTKTVSHPTRVSSLGPATGPDKDCTDGQVTGEGSPEVNDESHDKVVTNFVSNPGHELPAENPKQKICVFLQDHRFGLTRKVVIHMDLNVSHINGGTGETRLDCVRTRDVLPYLSKSPILNLNSQNVKIAYSYPENPEYMEYLFVGSMEKRDFEDSDTLQPVVNLPKDMPFTLHLELVGPEMIQIGGQSETPLTPGSVKPLEIARSRTATTSSAQGSAPSAQLDRVHAKHDLVVWLKGQLKTRVGYDEFKKSHHRTLSNPDAIWAWTFAVQFYDQYHNKRYSGDAENVEEVEEMASEPKDTKGKKKASTKVVGVKITKTAIEDALEVGPTWFTEAQTVDRLVKIFGQGGRHEDPAVVERLASTVDSAGRVALYEFLCETEKAFIAHS